MGAGGGTWVEVDVGTNVGLGDTTTETTDLQGDVDIGGSDTAGPGSGIDVNLDAETSRGQVGGDVSVGGEPVIETEVSSGADLGGADAVTEDVSAGTNLDLDAGVETDTTTVDAGTATTEGDLTIDVSAGSDTLGDSLTGSGSEGDPDSDSSEEDTGADNDDCNVLDPLSIPERCL